MYVNLIIQLEVLLVNLIITSLISTRKYSLKITIASFIVFTFLVVFLFALFRTEDAPQWWSILVGATFIIPLTLLFKESMRIMITVMFFCWTQTMIVLNISKSIGLLINDENLLLLYIIQTILLIAAVPYIIHFSKNTYKFIIDGIADESFKLLAILTTLLLSMTVALSYFISGPTVILISLLLLGATNLLVYTLLRNFVEKSNKVINLNKVAFTDSLTNLDNRLSLFTNTNILIESNTPFLCIYMDLDGLKKVNDTHGHNAGDYYLQSFAAAVKASISSQCTLYRIAGDEFVCITQNLALNIGDFNLKISANFTSPIPFQGVSMGCSTFPKDGKSIDDLFDVADKQMYKHKEKKGFRIGKRETQYKV